MIAPRRFVLDTNVLVSGLLLHGSVTARTFDLARSEGSLVFSEATFAEFLRVLARTKFDRYIGLAARMQFAELLRASCLIVSPEATPDLCRDPDDNQVLAVALAARAEVIVSGDADLLSLGKVEAIPILSPADFVRNVGGNVA